MYGSTTCFCRLYLRARLSLRSSVLPLKSSANRDGDVLWKLQNLRSTAGGFSFDARFQGRSLALEAVGAQAAWTSAAGQMRNVTRIDQSPGGIYYHQPEFRAIGGRIFHDVLWLSTNQTGAAFWAEGSFPHTVAANGERLTAAVAFGDGRRQVTTGDARLQVQWESPDGSRADLLDTRVSAAQELPEFSVDLTALATHSGRVVVRFESSRFALIGLANAYFYPKDLPVLYDDARNVSDARVPSPTPTLDTNVADPDGIAGWTRNVRLIDGAVYDLAMFTKPQTIDRGKARLRWPRKRIPWSGAILRGSVGYPAGATSPPNGGATVRLIIDDGVHKVPVRAWCPCWAWTSVRLGSACRRRHPDLRRQSPGVGIAFRRDGRWVGDWMRVATSMERHDDIAVPPPGSPPGRRRAVRQPGRSSSMAPSFVLGHYLLVARLNDDRADILAITRPARQGLPLHGEQLRSQRHLLG